jgi:hypothetical protein
MVNREMEWCGYRRMRLEREAVIVEPADVALASVIQPF